ncbi:hypothetical protein [Sphingomonas endophytica]|uniref:hypothetical protein n=1 Tax=Sphingomonas endophytica TaxID=869719 RepID=UPI000AE7CDDF|nr:hypothetical protein [Sphingomonas endophytica]
MTDWMAAIDAHRAVLWRVFVVALFVAFALERLGEARLRATDHRRPDRRYPRGRQG